jgi:acetylornithine deacetylase/succinyl-diaminopimelate desuccinylase-like protein
VIPAEATASLDIRLLPDTDPEEFLTTLKRVVGDTAVHFTTENEPKPKLENPINTDLFHAIEHASHDRDPDVLVTTPMLTAATDRPWYRKLGIVTYGFDPFRIEASEIQHGMHGNDERIPIKDLGFGLHYTYDVLRYVQ